MNREYKMSEEKDQFSVQKRIPLMLLGAIIANFTATIWWAAKIDSKVDSINNWIAQNRQVITRVHLLEERVKYLNKTIMEIKEAMYD